MPANSAFLVSRIGNADRPRVGIRIPDRSTFRRRPSLAPSECVGFGIPARFDHNRNTPFFLTPFQRHNMCALHFRMWFQPRLGPEPKKAVEVFDVSDLFHGPKTLPLHRKSCQVFKELLPRKNACFYVQQSRKSLLNKGYGISVNDIVGTTNE